MVARSTTPPVPPWVSLGGTSRMYRNQDTGEILSRRQYDKRYGLLARQGVTSYEKYVERRAELGLPKGPGRKGSAAKMRHGHYGGKQGNKYLFRQYKTLAGLLKGVAKVPHGWHVVIDAYGIPVHYEQPNVERWVALGPNRDKEYWDREQCETEANRLFGRWELVQIWQYRSWAPQLQQQAS